MKTLQFRHITLTKEEHKIREDGLPWVDIAYVFPVSESSHMDGEALVPVGWLEKIKTNNTVGWVAWNGWMVQVSLGPYMALGYNWKQLPWWLRVKVYIRVWGKLNLGI